MAIVLSFAVGRCGAAGYVDNFHTVLVLGYIKEDMKIAQSAQKGSTFISERNNIASKRVVLHRFKHGA